MVLSYIGNRDRVSASRIKIKTGFEFCAHQFRSVTATASGPSEPHLDKPGAMVTAVADLIWSVRLSSTWMQWRNVRLRTMSACIPSATRARASMVNAIAKTIVIALPKFKLDMYYSLEDKNTSCIERSNPQ